MCQGTRWYASGGDPVRDIDGIEAHEATDLDVWDPALRDEPSHVSLGDAQTFRHRTDVQQGRELVHISEWRGESRERNEKSRVKPSSHTLHHDARRFHETVAKIGTDMPVALSATGRLVLMPIRAELRDEHGTPIRGLDDPAGGTFDAAGDFDRVLSTNVELCQLLQYVDPYGDTVFNVVQMPAVLADVDRLMATELEPIEARGLARLRVMADRCRISVHLYLWFVGD